MDGLPSGVTDRFARAYQSLLEETREVMPATGLVLCEPFILNTGAPARNWKAWQTRLSEYRADHARPCVDFEAEYIPLQRSSTKRARAMNRPSGS